MTDEPLASTGGETYAMPDDVNRNNAKLSPIWSPEDAYPDALTWKTAATSVAVVDQQGVIRATNVGTTRITATSAHGLTATRNVEVRQAVTGVSIDYFSVTLRLGTADPADGTKQLTASIQPQNAWDKTVTWQSDNEAVAKVDGNGLVTAVNTGEATITVTASSGVTDTCKITVVHMRSSRSWIRRASRSTRTILALATKRGSLSPTGRTGSPGETFS